MSGHTRLHFTTLEAELAKSAAVINYTILRQNIDPSELRGSIRIRATLRNSHILEFAEYVSESKGQLEKLNYSYHWQDEQGKLLKRWDNAPHFLKLSNAPHHIHLDEENVVSASQVPDLAAVLAEIEHALGI